MKKALLQELDYLHEEEKHQAVIEKIRELSSENLSSDILGKLARAYANLGNYEEALKILKEIRKEEEHTSLWNYRVGHQYFELNNYEKARVYLEKAFEIDPEEPDVAYLLTYAYEYLANQMMQEENFEKFLEYCNKVKFYADYDKNIEELIWAESRLAWIYDRWGEFEEGKIHLDRLRELIPELDSWTYAEIAYNARGRGKLEEAIDNFHKSIACETPQPWIYKELGWCYSLLENYDKGIEFLSKGEELSPEDGWLVSHLGYSLVRGGYVEEGIAKLKASLNLENTSKIWVYSELGWIYDEEGRFEEAYGYLLEAEKLGRNDEWLNTEIGQCLGRLGKHEEAIEKLQQSLHMEEVDTISLPFLYSEIAWNYGKLKNYEKALLALEEAKKLGREDTWLYSEIGYNLSMKQNTLDKAMENFKKAKELGREDIWIYGQMGYVYERMGNSMEAVICFRKAKEFSAYDSWILYHFGKNLRILGEIPEAISILEQEIEISQFKGWGDLELAWCYALIDEKEKAEEYLNNVEEYLSAQLQTDVQLQADYQEVQALLTSKKYWM